MTNCKIRYSLELLVFLFWFSSVVSGYPFAGYGTRNCTRTCFGRQKTIDWAMENYNSDNETSHKELTPELIKLLLDDGYLERLPPDPGFGRHTSSNYMSTVDGKIFCLNHGFIRRYDYWWPQVPSAYEQLKAIGEKRPEVLARASRRPATDILIKSQLTSEVKEFLGICLIVFSMAFFARLVILTFFSKERYLSPNYFAFIDEESSVKPEAAITGVHYRYSAFGALMLGLLSITVYPPLQWLLSEDNLLETRWTFVVPGVLLFLGGAVSGLVSLPAIVFSATSTKVRFHWGLLIIKTLLLSLYFLPLINYMWRAVSSLTTVGMIPSAVTLYVPTAFFCGRFLAVAASSRVYLNHLAALLDSHCELPKTEIGDAL